MSEIKNMLDGEVLFEDVNLKNKVLESLGKGPEESITDEELLGLKELYVENLGITSLVGLENATNLVKLVIDGNDQINSLEPIKNIKGLQNLLMSNTNVSDLSPLTNMNLTSIWFNNTPVSDISFLETTPNVMNISLSNTSVTNIDILGTLVNVESITCNNTGVESFDVGLLANCSKLKFLYLEGISELRNLPILKNLPLFENLTTNSYRVTQEDIDAIKEISNLSFLMLFNAGITDVSAFGSLKDKASVKTLNLKENNIRDISALKGLKDAQKQILVKNQVIDLENSVENISGTVEVENVVIDVNGNKLAPKDVTYENDKVKFNDVVPSTTKLSYQFEDDCFSGTVNVPVVWKPVEVSKEGSIGSVNVKTDDNFRTYINFEITETIDNLGKEDVIEIELYDKESSLISKIESTKKDFLIPVESGDITGENPTGEKLGFGDVIPAGCYVVYFTKKELSRVVLKVISKKPEEFNNGDVNEDGVISEGEVLLNVVEAEVTSSISIITTEDGKTYACGDNMYGQLGVGPAISTQVFEPTRVLVDNIKEVISSGNHTFYITEDGIYACGRNYEGQLGLGHTKDVYTPTRLNIENVSKIVCDKYNTFFIMEDKTVKCCGMNACGQLGVGNNDVISDITPIEGLSNVKEVKIGRRTTLFKLENGEIYGCGDNRYGQLGIGNVDTTEQITPIKIRFKMK